MGRPGPNRLTIHETSSANDPTAVEIHGHLEQFGDLLRAIEEGRPPALDAHEARKAVAIISAIYRSAREGGRTVVL